MKTIITPIQMRFNDVDGFGHVNNSVYNEYLDCGRMDFIKQVFGSKFPSGTKSMVLVRIENNFLSPSTLYDELNVYTQPGETGEKTIQMHQQIVDKRGDVKVESLSVMSTFDLKEMCSFPMPEEWIRAIENFVKE